MKQPRIVVVGSSNTDLIVQTERIPAPGETVLGSDLTMAAGGKGANQAVAAARLGAQVTFVARLGVDDFGKQALKKLEAEDIDCSHLQLDPGLPSGAALIMVQHGGQNAIAVAPGANSGLSPSDVDRAYEKLRQSQALLLQLEVPVETVRHAADLARRQGLIVVLNPAPAQRLEAELLRQVSVLTPNESEAEILTGVKVEDESSARQAARKMGELGASSVVITLGEKGAYLLTKDEAALIPAPKVDAVDATAAGDAFNGALACALAAGFSIAEAVAQANVAGALSVTRLGAQPSLPTRQEVTAFRDGLK
ncbi:MAG TPA: ribokinase [Acidobacteriota bacterium]|nr:ribokinase [Acidobacteriota bacterium]